MIIDDPALVDAQWVESVLRRAGLLGDNSVERIECSPAEGRHWSRMIRIGVHYRGSLPPAAPARLLLKICGAEGEVFGPSEVHYYTRDYAGLAASPVPRCFDAVYQESPRRYHLLLEDLSGTHSNADDRQPTEADARALAGAVGSLHAFRWGAERLNAIDAPMPQRADFIRYMDHVGRGLEPLLMLAGDDIDDIWRSRLRLVFSRLVDRHAGRALDSQGITKIHGDLNPGNILVPLHGSSPIFLIDHQPFDWSLECWLGASDLVYAMVLFWETPLRRQLEMPALRHYHESIVERGIVGYSFDRLVDDYRHCIVEAIGAAVEWCVLEDDRERMRWLWTRHLRRALAAYEDLNCAEIWE